MKQNVFEGAVVETARGHKGIVTKYSYDKCTIEFECGFVGRFNTDAIRRMQFRSPNEKTYEGVGYIGEGLRGTKTDEKAYRYWRNMFDHSYGRLAHKQKVPLTVSDEFHNFQNFADFIEGMVGSDAYSEDSYMIQKDRFETVYSKYTVQAVAKNNRGNTSDL